MRDALRNHYKVPRLMGGFEEFEEDGKIGFRIYVKDGQRLVQSSTGLHTLPGDALRELAERLDSGRFM